MSESEQAALKELGLPEQALFVMSHYGYMTPEKFVLLVLAIYDGATVQRLSELTGLSVPTVRKHLRTWQEQGAVTLSGSGKGAEATFIGAAAWRVARWPDDEPQ